MKDPVAFVVVDLGFGDAGKGSVTDALTARHGCLWTARFHGGAQAGHNVVLATGEHHCFSQLGAGSFVPGTRTYLSKDFVFHPQAFLREAQAFASTSQTSLAGRVWADPGAMVITPPLQALLHVREAQRGANRHGSTGVGVGETVFFTRAHPAEAMRMSDLQSDDRLLSKLRRHTDWAVEQAKSLGGSASDTDQIASTAAWIDFREASRWVRSRIALLDEATWGKLVVKESASVVFEGAQGVLLDDRVGFYPYVTPSDCRATAALALKERAQLAWPAQVIGVLRAFPTRHGPGPFPTEETSLSALLPEPHNERGPHQGGVRHGYFDPVLGAYAVAHGGPIDGIVITHLDQLALVPAVRVGAGYVEPGGGVIKKLPPAPEGLAERSEWTRWVQGLRPIWAQEDASEPLAWAAAQADRLERPLWGGSLGPRREDVALWTRHRRGFVGSLRQPCEVGRAAGSMPRSCPATELMPKLGDERRRSTR